MSPSAATLATESSAGPKLEIQHAVYAATDGTGGMDVTAKLSELVRDGQLVVEANNDVLGLDPAVIHVKELRVDYTLDGKPGHATVHENETLTLPATTTSGQSPQWETSVASRRFAGRESVGQWPGRIAHRRRKNFARQRGGLARAAGNIRRMEFEFSAELGRAAVGHAGQIDFLDRPHE